MYQEFDLVFRAAYDHSCAGEDHVSATCTCYKEMLHVSATRNPAMEIMSKACTKKLEYCDMARPPQITPTCCIESKNEKSGCIGVSFRINL